MEKQDSIEKNNEELLLINIVEESVKTEVKKMIKSLGVCDCEKCYLDACAIALNALKPFYVTTTKGALFKKLENYNIENQTNVVVESTKAVLFVKDFPWHEHIYKVVND